MRGVLLIADAARVHPDGTFSILRGGVNRVQAPRSAPIHFRGSVVVRVAGDLAEAGPHEIRLRVLNQDGHSIQPDVTAQVHIGDGGGSAVAVIDFSFLLPGYGRYTFALLIDDQRADSWEVRAEEPEAANLQGSGRA